MDHDATELVLLTERPSVRDDYQEELLEAIAASSGGRFWAISDGDRLVTTGRRSRRSCTSKRASPCGR